MKWMTLCVFLKSFSCENRRRRWRHERYERTNEEKNKMKYIETTKVYNLMRCIWIFIRCQQPQLVISKCSIDMQIMASTRNIFADNFFPCVTFSSFNSKQILFWSFSLICNFCNNFRIRFALVFVSFLRLWSEQESYTTMVAHIEHVLWCHYMIFEEFRSSFCVISSS